MIQSLIQPLSNLLTQVLTFLPIILVAFLVFVVWKRIARKVRKVIVKRVRLHKKIEDIVDVSLLADVVYYVLLYIVVTQSLYIAWITIISSITAVIANVLSVLVVIFFTIVVRTKRINITNSMYKAFLKFKKTK